MFAINVHEQHVS